VVLGEGPRGWGDGFLIVGDSGGYLNSQRLKGIHLEMRSGMLAAETIFEALRDGGPADGPLPAERLSAFERSLRQAGLRGYGQGPTGARPCRCAAAPYGQVANAWVSATGRATIPCGLS
jgi:flavin-dependent dehydrogenase